MGSRGPQGQSLQSDSPSLPLHPVLLPVVGEGVEFWHLHGTGIGLVGQLVNQQPLFSLPDYAHLEKGDTLRPAQPAG